MTGSTLGMIITSIVVIVLAAWIILVSNADAHPRWRRKAPSGHGPAGLAARATAGRAEESPDLVSGEMDASPARQETGTRRAGLPGSPRARRGHHDPKRRHGAHRTSFPGQQAAPGRRGYLPALVTHLLQPAPAVWRGPCEPGTAG
jgi:hypothetical protein